MILVAYEGIEHETMQFIAETLGKYISVLDGGTLPLPREAYDQERNQWNAAVMIGSIEDTDNMILLVTHVDLFVQDLNFVFGVADRASMNALVSTNRLGSLDPTIARRRIIKEAVHEVGHLLDLDHCPDSRCVMHFSNSLSEVDEKGKEFCPSCTRHLEKVIELRGLY